MMNGSSPHVGTSHSNFSSASQIRLSHLKPPLLEPKGPLFLQQISVSLHIPKHDNELPDYNQSPIALADEQHSVRSLNMISGGTLEGNSRESSLNRVSLLLRKDTNGFMQRSHRSSDKGTIVNSHRERHSSVVGVDIFAKQAMERRERRHQKIEKFLDSKLVTIIMILITIYALFGQDFGSLITERRVDTYFDTLNLICVTIFFIELVLNMISKQDYKWSFFFWLDLISTLSILLDLSFIPSDAVNAQANAAQIARAGRLAKIGARAGRVLRVFRLVRIANVYKTAKDTEKFIRSNSHSIQSLTNLVDNIVKLKKKQGAEGKSQQTNLEFERTKSLTRRDSKENRDTKESNCLDPRNLYNEEKSPLAAHAPRRLSQFATIGKGASPFSAATPGGSHRRFEPQKMLVASFTEVNAKQVMKSRTVVNGVANGAANPENPNLPKESRVGKVLSDLTTKKTVIIVLITLIVVPMMASDSWSTPVPSYTYDTKTLGRLYENSLPQEEIDLAINDIISRHTSTNTPIIYFEVPNGTVVYQHGLYYTKIRAAQVEKVTLENVPGLLVAVDLSVSSKVTAATNMGRTLFICCILGLGALLFSKDANNLVLRPLERMIEKVNRIAVSPLSVKRENLLDENLNKRNETAVLENAITKLGTLLALGFGDAGAEIIAQNITQTGDMNPMVSGEKIMAVFGFCDIRNFTDATEVLQQDVMAFVNSIAELVHDKIDKYGGAANKNIGDAFLLVWKFPKSEVEEMDEELQLKNTDLVKGVADLSLFSFLKIFAKINQSHVLRKYRSNPKLLERLPNFRVKMGFGLHVGWAIEGAIGSEFKIDASYLSPNVNIASRLEAATKQYGVPLLVSNDLYVLFSEEVQRFCRKIDVVTVKGSQVPLALYTVDIEAGQLRDKGPSKRTKKERIKRHEMKKQKLMEMIWEGRLSTHLLFEKDKDLKIAMKKGFDVEQKDVWEEGMQAYTEGDWLKARLMFDRYMVLRDGDGPANTLLRFMSSLDYRAPYEWRGFRELTEK